MRAQFGQHSGMDKYLLAYGTADSRTNVGASKAGTQDKREEKKATLHLHKPL